MRTKITLETDLTSVAQPILEAELELLYRNVGSTSLIEKIESELDIRYSQNVAEREPQDIRKTNSNRFDRLVWCLAKHSFEEAWNS